MGVCYFIGNDSLIFSSTKRRWPLKRSLIFQALVLLLIQLIIKIWLYIYIYIYQNVTLDRIINHLTCRTFWQCIIDIIGRAFVKGLSAKHLWLTLLEILDQSNYLTYKLKPRTFGERIHTDLIHKYHARTYAKRHFNNCIKTFLTN